jgi:hypothetical protein
MPHPGFDVGKYQGDDVMQQLKSNGPYEWVGYYLKSPNHPDDSWMGSWKRALQPQGWGVAVLYVGLQKSDLNAGNGTAHGIDAVSLTSGDGFAPGTRIFLDVERHEQIGDDLAEYVKAWLALVAGDGNKFRPAIYCHVHNAAALQTIAADSGAPDVAFWVAGGAGFSLDKAPSASGISFATAWQGWLDIDDPSGTVKFKIDVSVSNNSSPSEI